MESPLQLFERQYLWNEAINHIEIFRPNNVILNETEQSLRIELINLSLREDQSSIGKIVVI